MFTRNYIDIHTHNEASGGISIFNIFPEILFTKPAENYHSIGLHPWYIGENHPEKMETVKNFAKNKFCIAIGETGLDKIKGPNFDLQKNILQKHIDIAGLTNKPLIIHCVRAFEEIIQIRRMNKSKVPWIIHGFNSKASIAERLVKEGAILSFGKDLAHSGSNAQKALVLASRNIFFLETDEGEIGIAEIYHHAAAILNVTIKDLVIKIEKDFRKIFRVNDE